LQVARLEDAASPDADCVVSPNWERSRTVVLTRLSVVSIDLWMPSTDPNASPAAAKLLAAPSAWRSMCLNGASRPPVARPSRPAWRDERSAAVPTP
jgi:hypothetical protein